MSSLAPAKRDGQADPTKIARRVIYSGLDFRSGLSDPKRNELGKGFDRSDRVVAQVVSKRRPARSLLRCALGQRFGDGVAHAEHHLVGFELFDLFRRDRVQHFD